MSPFRLNQYQGRNEKSPGWNRGSTVTETIETDGYAHEHLATLILHTPWLEARGLCHDNTEIHPQPARGAAPPSSDPAVDIAAAAAGLPNSIGGLDGAVSPRFSIGGR